MRLRQFFKTWLIFDTLGWRCVSVTNIYMTLTLTRVDTYDQWSLPFQRIIVDAYVSGLISCLVFVFELVFHRLLLVLWGFTIGVLHFISRVKMYSYKSNPFLAIINNSEEFVWNLKERCVPLMQTNVGPIEVL